MKEWLSGIWAVFGWYFILFVIVFGLGLPIAFVRRLLGRKKDYWPDTEDVLIGMGMLLASVFLWGAWSLRAGP
ncbi:MAG: hypothetical protein ACLP0B_19480 [Steroidobacteraceae bacterium]